MVLRKGNKLPLKTGAIQTQPTPKKPVTISSASIKAISVSTAQTTAIATAVPAQQVTSLNTSFTQAVTGVSNKDFSQIPHTLPNGSTVSSGFTNISSDSLSAASEAIKSPIFNKISGKQVENNKKSSFEALTNISNKRPEIIALTNFNPIYGNSNDEKTEQGKLFDVYVETMRQLEANATEIAKDSLAQAQNAQIKNEIKVVREVTQSIYDILRRLSEDRSRISLHNSIYQFSPQEFVNSNIKSDSKSDIEKIKKIIIWGGGKVDIPTVISQIAGIEKSFTKQYASTKLWQLLLKEVRYMLEGHSRNFIAGNGYNNLLSSFEIPVQNRPNAHVTLKKIQDSAKIKDRTATLRGDLLGNSLSTYSANLAPLITALQDGEVLTPTQLEEFFSSENLENVQNDLEGTLQNVINMMVDIDSTMNNISPEDPLDQIALSFHLLSKEIRHSSCYITATDKLFNSIARLSLGTGADASTVPLYEFFGKIADGSNILEPGNISVGSNRPGLLDFCYYDTPEEVVTSLENEDLFESSTSKIKNGGEYFFDQSKIIQFTDVSTSYDLLTRLTRLSDRVSSLDDSFSTVATELGLLSTKDSEVFKKDVKPDGKFSTDPETFLENIYGNLTKELQKLDAATSKNADLGINTLIKFAASTEPHARSIRACLFLMALATNRDLDDFLFLDVILRRTIERISNSKAESKTEILADETNILVNANAAIYDNSQRTFFKTMFLSETYRKGSYSYLPCRYETVTSFGESIRNNPTFKVMTDIMKNVRDIFFSYASIASEETTVGKIDIFTILLVLFNMLCKIVEKSEKHEIAWARVGNNNTLSARIKRTFVEAVELYSDSSDIGNIQESQQLFKSTNLIANNSSGTWGIEIFAKINEDDGLSNKTKIKNAIKGKLYIENSRLNFSILALLNTLKVYRSNVESSLNTVKKLNPKKLQILSGYMDDPKHLEFLLVEPQLTLLLSNIEDLYQSFNTFSNVVESNANDSKASFINYQESLAHSKKVVDILKNFFSSSEFREKKGYNKKIITVGLAQGLIKNHIEKAAINSSNSKHDDIIKLLVYKIDLINNDIVYKPKSFLFEASRYPVRVPNQFLTDTADFSQIPTRNYSFSSDVDRQGESFYYNSGELENEYSFLTLQEKNELIRNHGISFLLENYIKITTGIILGEVCFNVTPAEAQSILNDLENKSSFIKETSSFLPGPDSVFRFEEKLYPSTNKIIRQLVQPKKFDRVFNIIFDPEFVVDEEKSNIEKLNALIKQGKFQSINKLNPSEGIIDADKSANDPALDAYFVVLETHAKSLSSESFKLKDKPSFFS